MVQHRCDVVSGKVEVFGAQVKEMKRILVREGKRLPFFVREKAVFDISLGVNAASMKLLAEALYLNHGINL